METLKFFRPKVVHSLPGRIRLKVPSSLNRIPTSHFENLDWDALIRPIAGIKDVQYSPETGNALVHYDPELITESVMLSALERLSIAAAKASFKVLAAPPEIRRALPERLAAWLKDHPIDVASDSPLEISDEIWR